MFIHEKEIRNLDLPLGEYAVFGSGPMAVRDIRDATDADILVSQKLWNHLVNMYSENLTSNPQSIRIGNIEIFKQWIIGGVMYPADEIIKTAEIIDGIAFANLNWVRKWKSQGFREKDLEDVKLIDSYLKK
ncbi:hypothetical protein CL684_02565 [Candidatus Campbellbacteria bacterium]|nr:hypothetical protein [Candidatus Campbellbacteria bacterium]|tara:strand:+ start:350 stop:742 length:393 start_codon:yes stop_codon:yes gene_type:complete